eukprot:Amastigsp_a841227_555.p4 type:complete len:122 gc:universal Amastigsp_a841227_555:667-302(-)
MSDANGFVSPRRSISGDRYDGEPQCASISSVGDVSARASPKSMSTTRSPGSTRMLSSLRSRWQTHCACRYSSAETICANIRCARGSSSRPPLPWITSRRSLARTVASEPMTRRPISGNTSA